MVLIEKLQHQVQVERQKHRFEQIKSATDTIDKDDDVSQTDHDEDSVKFDGNGNDNGNEPHLDRIDDDETDNEEQQDNMMMLDDTDNDNDDDLDYNPSQIEDKDNKPLSTPIPIESVLPPRSDLHDDLDEDLKRKQDELNKSKKLLNLYCSPQHRARVDTQQQISSKSTSNNFTFINSNNNNDGNNNNNNSTSLRLQSLRANSKDATQMKAPKPFDILPPHDDRTSVQLTPFHTPQVKSKTRSFTSNPSSQFNTKPSFNNNISTSNNNQNNNNELSNRSTTHSPLFGSRIINEVSTSLQPNNNNHSNIPHQQFPNTHNNDLSTINENHQPPRVRNVFSRLTNPKHFIGTARNRVQELQALKEKVRKQKESHSQLQRRSTWQKRKAYQSPPNDHHNMSNEWQLNHHQNNMQNNNNNNNENFNENSFNDSSVFERLHTASIRNKRHNTSHYDLNSSLNMDQIDNNDNNEQMLVNNNNEASRVIAAENEISKKPQRNNSNENNNNGNKSLLMNPVRVLTPDA